MGRIRCPLFRQPHRLHRDRSPKRHRLVYRRRMDRRSHLVSETEAEPGILYRHRIHSDTSYRIDLRSNVEKTEREGRRADQVTFGRQCSEEQSSTIIFTTPRWYPTPTRSRHGGSVGIIVFTTHSLKHVDGNIYTWFPSYRRQPFRLPISELSITYDGFCRLGSTDLCAIRGMYSCCGHRDKHRTRSVMCFEWAYIVALLQLTFTRVMHHSIHNKAGRR